MSSLIRKMADTANRNQGSIGVATSYLGFTSGALYYVLSSRDRVIKAEEETRRELREFKLEEIRRERRDFERDKKHDEEIKKLQEEIQNLKKSRWFY